ncbi:MAG: DUF3320 domain-containing protein [Dongiaceae bacterium]
MGPALLQLTPCLLMSPLSVAQFLPPGGEPFDLVVFDEASQITVPDAIGAIARGRRCIVVGDPRQMPPTRFFERGAEAEEEESERDLESILDEALAARVPHHRLTGHYRSRHESLICFSNHAYYGGALVTYPSADTRDSAVTFRRIDGVYAKGSARTNEIEARAVVAEVLRRLRDPGLARLSLGIVTLNAEQQRLIEDLLDQARRADPELEPFFALAQDPATGKRRDPVFVKNLETVQGDERDVVLLSIGYGPTEPGGRAMSMNFGPLNRAGGERRLNVAITRATTEVVVFASLDPGMIDLHRTSAEAVRDLRRYLDYAQRGPVALGEALHVAAADRYDSDFELALAERLRRRGWTVRSQVGVSRFRIDLGIVHPDQPGRFLAGVECDGAAYHSSPTARDRDRVRQAVLERLGWHLFRVWSTDFFLDARAAVDALDARLRMLLEAERAAAQPVASGGEGDTGAAADDGAAAATEAAPEQDDEGEEESGAVPRWDDDGPPAPPSGGLAEPAGAAAARFHDPSYTSELAAMAAAIIDAEGPITFKRLSDRLARAHGFQRTGTQIAGRVWTACRRLRRFRETPDGHKVFWPAGSEPQPQIRFRGLAIAGETRAWREVPHPEKLWLVRDCRAADPDDTARAVAEAIGFGRVTATFRSEIAELLRQAEGAGDGV